MYVKIQDQVSFLIFSDWHTEQARKVQDWTLIASTQKEESSGSFSDFFTFSALASTAKGNLKRLLSRYEWEVDATFGRPSWGTDAAGEFYYDPGLSETKRRVRFMPFVLYRHFHDYIPAAFEVVQNFILYYDAFWVANKGEYQYIDEDGTLHALIRMKQMENNRSLWVNTHQLRHYLAANKCYLVRYHDHRRMIAEDNSSLLGEVPKIRILRSEHSMYSLSMSTDSSERYKRTSHLLGKDIILPYSRPNAGSLEDDEELTAAYIVDRDEEGKEIELPCKEKGERTSAFLTLVFFRMEVLSKYYNEPRRYSVSGDTLRCLDLWYLPLDRTEEDFIQVWLGDLGRIPYREQLHWRQFNVLGGSISEKRLHRDILAEFVESDDPVSLFRTAFEEIQHLTEARYGEPLFLALDEKDMHLYETLHLPLTEEWKEFDEQVQALAKVTVDSLNVSLLTREAGQKSDGKSLKLLDGYVSTIGILGDRKQQILSPFHVVQTIRSTGAAHRKGSDFESALRRFQLDDLPNNAKIEKMLSDLTTALSMINDALV